MHTVRWMEKVFQNTMHCRHSIDGFFFSQFLLAHSIPTCKQHMNCHCFAPTHFTIICPARRECERVDVHVRVCFCRRCWQLRTCRLSANISRLSMCMCVNVSNSFFPFLSAFFPSFVLALYRLSWLPHAAFTSLIHGVSIFLGPAHKVHRKARDTEKLMQPLMRTSFNSWKL